MARALASVMFVYALRDPNTGDIRYVGKTTYSDPMRRLSLHVRDSKYLSGRRRTRLQEWMSTLQEQPILTILDVNPSDMNASEIEWIATLREGCNLLNITKGGAGVSSREHKSGRPKGSKNSRPLSAESRARMSAAKCGSNHPLFGKPNPLKGTSGRWFHTEESKAKIRLASLQQWAERRAASCG